VLNTELCGGALSQPQSHHFVELEVKFVLVSGKVCCNRIDCMSVVNLINGTTRWCIQPQKEISASPLFQCKILLSLERAAMPRRHTYCIVQLSPPFRLSWSVSRPHNLGFVIFWGRI
jgi:hypothetical protein